MRPIDVVRAIVYPLTESSVLIPLLVFWLLLALALWAGLFGLLLLFIVIPAVFRYQMIVLEARARGVTPATPDLALFNWFGKSWTLFPVFVALFLTWATVAAGHYFGTAWAIPARAVRERVFSGLDRRTRDHTFTAAEPESVGAGSSVEALREHFLDGDGIPDHRILAGSRGGIAARDAGQPGSAVPVVCFFLAGRQPDCAPWPDRGYRNPRATGKA